MTASSLSDTAAQLFDKISDLVVGPVQGTVLATALDTTSPIVVPQGQIGALPDGRLVRALYGKRVRTTAGIPVRLLFLSPSVPRAGQFTAIASGTTVAWQNPPPGISPTGVATSAFGHTARAGIVRIVSAVEYVDVQAEDDLFKAGAQGGSTVILLEPEVLPIEGISESGEQRYQLFKTLWKIRVNVSTSATDKNRRVAARLLFDNLVDMIQGAQVGDSPLQIAGWKLVRRAPGTDSWELRVIAQFWSDGRAMQPEAVAGLGTFADIAATIVLPGDTDQPNPFRVSTTLATPNAFSDAFDDSFGGGSGAEFSDAFDGGFG